MITREENPEYLNSFLYYSATILNKSPNSIKEYNYDLGMFLRFIKLHFNMTKETDFNRILSNTLKSSPICRMLFPVQLH